MRTSIGASEATHKTQKMYKDLIIALLVVLLLITVVGLILIFRKSQNRTTLCHSKQDDEHTAAFISQPAPVGYGKPNAPKFPQAASPFIPVEDVEKKN